MWMLLALALSGAAEPTATAPPAAPPAPVVRTYAMRQKFVSQMKDPNPFDNVGWRSTHTYTWALVTWRQLGDRVDYKERTCGVWTQPVFGGRPIYRPAFIRGVPVRDRSGTLSESGGDGAIRLFRAGPYPQQFGVKLADPFDDALPTAPDDPRLSDDDQDGKPGVTVEIYHPLVGSGEVYIAQRSIVSLEGELLPDGVVRGYVRTAPDMVRIDGNRWWLKMDSPQRPHPDPRTSPFVMVEMPTRATCDDVLAQKDTLFEGKEPDPTKELGAR